MSIVCVFSREQEQQTININCVRVWTCAEMCVSCTVGACRDLRCKLGGTDLKERHLLAVDEEGASRLGDVSASLGEAININCVQFRH